MRLCPIRTEWTKETSWQDVSSFGHQRKRPCKDMPPRKGSEEPLFGIPALIGRRVRNCRFGDRHTCADTFEESRQMKGIAVDKLQMNAAERMNSLEGVEETASSPQLTRALLKEPLDGEQEKTALTMKSRGSPSSSTGSSILDKRQPDREISFHQLLEGNVPLYQKAERVPDEWVKTRGSLSSSTILEKCNCLSSLRRLHGKLRSLCSLKRLHLPL